MKDNIKIALLAIIAGTLIYQTASSGNSIPPPRNQPSASAPPPPSPMATNAANKSTFDPLTPPATPPINEPVGPSTTVKFEKPEHDFGNIKQDTDNPYVFSFTNTGKEPLVITNAQGSCGCTVPDYPKHPIAPGAKGEIRVEYKPGKQEGNQSKTVTVTANTEPAQTVLRIKANVQKVG